MLYRTSQETHLLARREWGNQRRFNFSYPPFQLLSSFWWKSLGRAKIFFHSNESFTARVKPSTKSSYSPSEVFVGNKPFPTLRVPRSQKPRYRKVMSKKGRWERVVVQGKRD
nr:hypothetical protein Q903MT_gene379 [Picea sitchensis]